jgi:hypothetical protein
MFFGKIPPPFMLHPQSFQRFFQRLWPAWSFLLGKGCLFCEDCFRANPAPALDSIPDDFISPAHFADMIIDYLRGQDVGFRFFAVMRYPFFS